jgi:gliding motility-associated-like protein
LADDAFLNTTNAQVSVIYTVVPISALGCQGASFTVTVPVNPQPVVAVQTPAAVCSRTPVGVNFNASTSVAAATYNVTALNLNGLTVSAGGATAPINGLLATALADDAFLNTTNAQVSVIYTVVPVSAAGCQGASFTVTVPVDPQPVVAVQTPVAVCSGIAVGVNFNASTSVAAATYNVTGLNLNGLSVSAGGAAIVNGLVAADLADDAFLNTTNAQVSVIYTVVPISALGCQGASFTVTVPVNPRPIIPDQVSTICSGATFTVTPINSGPTVVPAGTQYTWTAPTVAPIPGSLTGAGAQAVGVASISQTLTNTTNVVQTATYIVTPTSGAGCAGATFQVTVTVNPKPVIFNRVETICSGGTFTISPADGLPLATTIVPASTTYTWGAPVVTAGITGGSAQSGQASISQTLSTTSTAPGTATYTVTPTSGAAGACVGATFQVVVTVNPIPKLSSTLTPAAICSGLFTYTPTSATATATFTWTRAAVSGINESASAGSGSVSETLTNPTTLPVVVTYKFITSANGCNNAPGEDVQVTVNPTPLPNAIIGPANVCVSSNTFFYQVTQVPGSTYSWDVPAEFTVQAAGGGATPGGGQGLYTSDYFILLKFSTATTKTLSVYEKSADGCVGLVNILPIIVSSGPTVVDITSGAFTSTTGGTFCKNQTGVVFQVPQNASSNFIWTIDSGGSIVGPAAGTNLYQIVVNFNNSPTANINVTEINLAGCPATYPTFVASMLDAPAMTPATGSICSGAQPSDVITLSTTPLVLSTFSWFVKSITANVTGAFVNQTGTGPLSHAIPLQNISGINGTIVYTVTPTATSAPFCIGLPQDYTVTIKPEPVVSSVTDQSVCPLALVNGAVSFPFSSNVGGAIFNWTSSNPAIGLAAASGTGAISFIAADNTTGLDIVSIITVTATANGCTSAGANAKTFTITVKPRPVVGAVADISVCPGDAISVPAFTANTSGGETYAWTNSNALIGLPLTGNGNISAYFAPANNTGSNLVGNISVIATTNGCPGPARTFNITVKPQPVVVAITDKTFCAGDAISIPLSSNVGSATINWSNSNTGIGLAASGTGNIVGVAPVNNSGVDIVGTITVTASDNGCTSSGSNSKTFTITIKPTPIVDPLPNVVVCSGGAISTITFASNVSAGAVTFNWTNDNPAINLGASGTGNIAGFTAATNISGLPQIANISVIGTKNGCAGPAVLFTITVNPEPVVALIANQLFCPADVVSIPLTSNVGAATINWTNSNTAIGLLSNGSGNINFTAAANNTGANITATISVTATAAGCTSAGANAKSFTITIKPTPIVTAVTDVTVCSGATIPALVFSANTGGSEVFNWTNDNITIGQPATGSGNISSYLAPVNTTGVPMVANFSVIATKNSCAGPAITFKITVNPEPVVAPVANQSFCAGESISIPLTSNVVGAVLSWSNTNTSIGLAVSGSGNISYIAPVNNSGVDIVGSITVIATANGCVSVGANTKTFSITIKPTPIVTAIPNVTVCSGGSVAGLVFSSNVVAGSVTFDWTNDNTAINLGPSGTGNIAGFTAPVNTTSSALVATISVTGTKNTCVGPAKTFTITVLPQPVGTPTLKTICSDEAVTVNLSTLITGGAAASTYDITITPNGLTASAGAPVSGTGKSATEIQDDKWTNITGSPVNVIYTITPNSIGSPSCAGAPFDLTVTVNPEPVVAVVANQIFCPSEVVSIPLTSNVVGATISWTNTNPSIGLAFSGTGNINYTTAVNNTGANVTATISVIASNNGCTSTGANAKSFTITIKPSPIVAAVTDVTVCSGATIPAITFSANTGGSEVFNWTNDNALIGLPVSGSGNISSYVAPVNVSGVPMVANFIVSATKNGCTGPNQTFKITVNPEPVVAAVANQSFCTGEAISIPLTSNVAGAVISWTNTNSSIGLAVAGSGNISYIAPANNTGADIVGTITVIGTANGCVSAGSNAKSFTITIKPTPIVNAVTNIVVCSGQTVAAIAFISNVGAGVTYDWSNDNTAINLGPSGSGPIPSFTAATNTTSTPFVATISVTGTKNGCLGPVRNFTITVNPQPVGIPTLATVCSDQAVSINLATLLSGSAASYSLSINSNGLTASAGAPANGSGFSATEIQDDKWTNVTGAPVNVVYTITPLGAGSPACAGAPFDLTVTINPEPVVMAIANKIYCPASVETIPLLSNVPGASITWTNTNPLIGLGFSGSGDINFTTPANNTGANITGTITVMASKDGCTSSGTNIKTFDITIKPTPIVAAVADITVCSGALVPGITFSANTGGAETFNWTNNNALIGVAASGIGNIAGYTAPVNISGVPMVANFSVVATKNSCSGPAVTFKITINPEPVVGAITDKTFCAGDAINIPFTSNVAGASISWTNSNASIGIGTSGAGDMIYTAPSNNTGADIVGTIVVTASMNGCVSAGANTKTFTVTIKPTPIVNAMADIVVCSGQTITVPSFGSNVVAGGVTFNWTNDNPAINLVASGTGDIVAFTAATNISGLPITANISVTGTKNLCAGPAKTFTITINPEPVVAAVTDKFYCPGDLVNIPLTSNVIGAAISWTNSNTLIGTTATGSGDIVFTAPVNNTGTDFVGTIVVSANKNGCTSIGANTKTFNITVYATPIVAAITSVVVCSGDPIAAFAFTSNADPGVTFNWTNDNTAINLGASGTGNIAGFTSAVNLGSTPIIANISVRGTKNGCQGAARNFTITINPQPVLSVPAPPAICSSNLPNNPSTTGIVLGTNGTSVNANTYRINSILYNGGTAPAGFTFPVTNKSVGSSGGINHIQGDVFTNTSLVPVTVRYNITPISLLGCEGVATNVDLVVNPEPKLDPTLSPTPICSGDKIDPTGVAFQLRSQPAVSVASASFIIRSISFPVAITAGGSNTGIGAGKSMDALDNDTYSNVTSGPLTVTYTIAPVSAAGCIGPDQTVTITVNPAPALSTSLNKIVCSGEASTITMATTGSTIAATSYNYLSVTATGLTPGGSNVDLSTAKLNQPAGFISADRFTNTTNAPLTATYVVSPVSAVGCVGPPVSVVLTVEPAITMVIPTQVPLCSYSANSLSQTSFVLNSVVTPSAGNITYDYTAFSTPASAVSGFFASQGNLPGGTTISDKLVNNTNAVATVTYVITPKAVGAKGGLGCSAATPTTLVVSVEPQPRLSITPATQVICEGAPTTMVLSSTTVPGTGTIQFTKVSTTATGGMTLTSVPKTTYLSGEQIGDVWSNPTITTQTVTYVFRSQIVGGLGCNSEDITVLLTVNPNPTIVASVQAPICSSDFVNITLSPDVDNTVSTYTVSSPPTISGASGGAGNLIFQTLSYNSLTPTVANIDAPVTFNYTVTPRANNCAGAAIVVPVTVNPKPKLLNIPSTLRICHGNNLSIPLTSNVTGANYTWTVDNPSGLSGIVEQTTPGSGSINQIVTNTTGVQASLTYTIKAFGPGATSCEGDQKIVIVTVAPQMAASFQNLPSSICKGTSEFLIVQLDGQAPFSFIYNQNDGVTNSDVTVNGAGNFKVIQVNPTLTTTYTIKSIRDGFNCPLTITGQAVTISVGDPDPNFSVLAPSAACGPVQFQFQYNQKAGTQYTWQWQDGTADSTYLAVADVSNKVVRHTFPNLSPNRDQDYNVVLRVELPAPFPGCFKSASKKVTVYSAIVTNVFADKTTICSGDKIQFTNQSLGVTSHKWFWRNVGTSLENEIKTTSSADYSLVNNTTTNPLPLEVVYRAKSGNCSAPDVVIPINVYRGVTANFSEGIVPPFSSGSSTVTYTNTSTPFDVAQFRYDWTFGITGDANPVTLTQTATGGIPVVYSSPGTKTIILSVTNKAAEAAGLSCKSDINKNITIILPPLTASFDIDPTELCFPGSIKLKNVVGTGFIHEWRVVNKATGASFTSNVANPGEFKVSAPGIYSVSYRTSLTATGQSANAPLKDVTVYDLPLASFDLRPDIVYVPDTEMSAFNFSSGANGYEWTFGDGGTSTDFEPKYTYKVEGKYDVTLIAKFDHGKGVICRDTLTRVIIAKQGGVAKIPNSFTPNPNGRSSTGTGGNGTFNDVFLPLVKGISNDSDAYNLQIYDRWGNLVFESTSSVVGWDGYNNDGKLMPMGVYVYKLTVRFSDSQRTTTVGDITMLY